MQSLVIKCMAQQGWCFIWKKKWLEELPPYQGGGGMIREVKKDRISYGDLPTSMKQEQWLLHK